MDEITIGEICRNMDNFIKQNSEEHKEFKELLKDGQERMDSFEKILIQIKPLLWVLSLIVCGVAIPLIYKFLEIKIFGG